MIAGLVPGTWLTVANYVLAFGLCLIASRRDGRTDPLWAGIALVMLLLTLNKVFEIETYIAETGRALAKEDGLYHSRRMYQRIVVKALLVLLAFVLVVAWQRLRSVDRHVRISAIALLALCFFVVARAISYHNVDRLLNRGFAVIKLNGLIENGLVLGLAAGAVLALRAGRQRSGPDPD